MERLTVEAGGWTAVFSPIGAALLELTDPLGFCWIPRPPPPGRHLFGAVAGPWANRLPAAEWGLTANQGRLHLHGGHRGTDLREWAVVDRAPDRLTFRLDWPEGDEGYPSLWIEVRYVLRPAALRWDIQAGSARPVPLNPVNHAYWNLGAATVEGHRLWIDAEGMHAPDAEGMTRPPVRPNPFASEAALTGDWDHTFLLSPTARAGKTPAAVLSFRERRMEVFTDCPSLHLYTGHFLPHPRSGVCLECGLPPGRWGLGAPAHTVRSWTEHRFVP